LGFLFGGLFGGRIMNNILYKKGNKMIKILIYTIIGIWIYNQIQLTSIVDIQHLIEAYLNGAIEAVRKILGV